VVDDAIVVLENIHRHIEEGMTPFEAALRGGREIGFAVIAMTLTLAAVYVPIAFQTGTTGKLFVEFALTLAGAVIVSGFVALTLSPMMCSRLLRHEAQPGRFYLWGERVLDRTTELYRGALERVIGLRWFVVAGLAAALVGAGLLWRALPDELSPKEDPGFIMVFGQGPEGATLDFMDKYARQIEDIYKGVPEIDRYFLFVGWPNINNTISFPGLKDWGDRKRSAQEIQGQLFGQMMGIPGIMAFPNVPNSLGGGFMNQDLEFIVQTTESFEELNKMVEALKARMQQSGKFLNPRSDLEMNKPELHVDVDRDKVAAIGADVATVGRTLETMMGGRQVTRFKRGSEQYDVLVQLGKDARRTPDALTEVYVRGKDGAMVPLSNLVNVSEGVSARELNHFNKLRAASISASLAPGMSLAQGIDWMDANLKQVAGDRASYDLGGQSREFRKIQSSTALLFGLALAFIYLVLAAQFESFRDPLIILLSVPLAIGGALFALWILHLGAGWGWWRIDGSLNIYSKIGLVTLIGLIAKHGILIVEFANQRARAGVDLAHAVLEAAALRLRPILMTTGAMVLGAVPLAFAHGAGAEARAQIGWAVVGGMSFGTLFTLFVVPVMYTLLASRRHGEAEASGIARLAPA
jgi:multidrug efflux pump